MWRRLSATVAALAVAGSMIIASAGDADARHRHRGAFIGGLAVGALAFGALSAHRGDAYYHDDYEHDRCFRGRPRCHWVRGECYRDHWGDYQCDGGYRSCYRPLICD